MSTTTTAPDATIEIRVLPWRPRRRRIELDPNGSPDLLDAVDDPVGVLIGIGVVVLLYVAAPLLGVVLAILLLPVEVWVALVLGVLLLLARFTGVIPWTVAYTDDDGVLTRERFRFLPSAARRVRELTGDAGPRVRWHWA